MVRRRAAARCRLGGIRKKLSEDPEFTRSAWLVRNGVPFSVAFGMDAGDLDTYRMPDDVRIALSVVFGQFDGNRYNWATHKWEERR